MSQFSTQDESRPVDDGSHPARWKILAIVGMAQFMVMLDSTVANVALPAIGEHMPTTPTDQQWIIDAYVLMFGSLLLLGGRFSDVFGRRRTFLTGLVVFTAASVVCGFANSAAVLIGARSVQGVGAAMLSPAAMSIVVTVFRNGVERRTALTIWAALAGLGGTIGVVMGGALITFADWRWAFWINLPIALLVLPLALALVPALRPQGVRRRLDLPGGLLSTVALGSLIYACIGGGSHGWLHLDTVLALAIFVIATATLIVSQRRTEDPLLAPHVLANATLRTSGIGLALVSALMIAIFYMTSIFQQRVLGFTALQAGLGVVGMGLPTLLMTFVIPKLMGRIGPPKVYTVGATLILLGALLLVVLPSPDAGYWGGLLPGLVLVGAGLPCCFASLNTMGVMVVAPRDAGIASGILTAFTQTGAALGIAAIVSLAQAHTQDRLAHGASQQLALTDGFRWGYITVAVIAVLKIALSTVLARGMKRAMAANTEAAQA